MIILGIDPGSRRMGYGIIEVTTSGAHPALRDVGLIKITAEIDNPGALAEMRAELGRLIDAFRPTHLAIEKLFFLKNRTTGIAVAEARGVVLTTAHEHGLAIHEYAPNEIKLALTGDGSADKRAIAKMVRLLLRETPTGLIDDATDALAIALVGAARIPLAERMAGMGTTTA